MRAMTLSPFTSAAYDGPKHYHTLHNKWRDVGHIDKGHQCKIDAENFVSTLNEHENESTKLNIIPIIATIPTST